MSKPKIFRDYKGKSLIDFPDNYVIIDIETTGFDPTYDEIIELSAVKIENDTIINTFSQLVNPDCELDLFIQSITGLTNSSFKNHPKLSDVLDKYIEFLGDSILVGHNVNFDVNFLYDACMRILNKPLVNDFIDTMRISRKLHPDIPHHRLDDLIEYYSVSNREFHRAENDCMLTNQILIFEKNEALQKYDDIESFQNSFKKKRSYRPHAADISADSDVEFDETHPLYGKVCVFTGVLENMVRKEAMQKVVNLGGLVGDSVTKKTNYLILGNNDYCKSIKDGKSSKQKKAEELKLKGHDIEVISENVFYDMLEC